MCTYRPTAGSYTIEAIEQLTWPQFYIILWNAPPAGGSGGFTGEFLKAKMIATAWSSISPTLLRFK